MESLAFQNLQAFNIDFMLFIEADVLFRKIVPDHAHHFYRSKKAGRDRSVTCAASEQARVF